MNRFTMAIIGAALLTLILSPSSLFRRDFELRPVDLAPKFARHLEGVRA